MANSLITLLAPTLLGTPIGWSMVCLTVIAGLGFYYAMDATSMTRLINPSFDGYHTLQNELQAFVPRYHDDLAHIKCIKERFIEKKPTQTATENFKSNITLFERKSAPLYQRNLRAFSI
jgi:hypothetical protein